MGVNKRILSPQIGSIVKYIDKQYNSYDVYIISGQYMGDYNRISNFWYFRKVKPNGELGKLKSDYGNFFETDNKYDISIKIVKI